MHTLVMLSPGPRWIAGEPVGRQDRAVIGPHLLRMRDLFDRGAVIFGGPTADGFGGIVLLETESADSARTIIDADPAVIAGLMTYELTPLNPYFDAFSGRAWSPPLNA